MLRSTPVRPREALYPQDVCLLVQPSVCEPRWESRHAGSRCGNIRINERALTSPINALQLRNSEAYVSFLGTHRWIDHRQRQLSIHRRWHTTISEIWFVLGDKTSIQAIHCRYCTLAYGPHRTCQYNSITVPKSFVFLRLALYFRAELEDLAGRRQMRKYSH